MFSSSGRGSFDKALDKGTSAQNTDADWDSILMICDLIRAREVKARFAVDSLMKKISSDNSTVTKFALQILESVVKNCGPTIHNEIATQSFMKFMKEQAKATTDENKAKILELIQCWAHAFRDNADFRSVGDTFTMMKNEGFSFGLLKEADAMFTSDVPPEWKEGENCFGCRTEFGTFTRKHHCRSCGQIFCSKCSSKSSAIPKFGIEKEVRVCDPCYGKLSSGSSAKSDSGSDLPPEYLTSPLAKQSQGPPAKSTGGKSEQEIEEEEQLQLALAISQSEAEAKEQEKRRRQNYMSLSAQPPPGVVTGVPASTSSAQPTAVFEEDAMSPELMKYLNRNYWEKKQKDEVKQSHKSDQSAAKSAVSTTIPSAPPPTQSDPSYSTSNTTPTEYESYQNGAVVEDDGEREQFMNALSGSIDVFVNRMKSNSMRGRSIVTDSAVQTLFATLQNMHPQLITYANAQEDKRSHFESLQDKLAQLRDARDALIALRQEHAEKKRIEAEERERRKQIQMAQKLEILRKKKQESLEIQRQMALQRMQQQEAEMRARLEQQKLQTQMRQMQLHGFPQELQPGYAPQYNQMMAAGQTDGYGQQQQSAYNMSVAGVVPGGSQQYSGQNQQAPTQMPGPDPSYGGNVAQVPISAGYSAQPGFTSQGYQGYQVQQQPPPQQQQMYSGGPQQPFNVQAMNEALPQTTQSRYVSGQPGATPAAQQQYGAVPDAGQYGAPISQQYGAPVGPQGQQYGVPPATQPLQQQQYYQQQQPPPQQPPQQTSASYPAQDEQQLISFD